MGRSVTAQACSRSREDVKRACKRAFALAISSLNLTQEQVASELGVSVSRVRRLVSPDYPDVVPSTVDVQLASVELLNAFELELRAQRSPASAQDAARVVARVVATSSRVASASAEALASARLDGPALAALAREATHASSALVDLVASAHRRAA